MATADLTSALDAAGAAYELLPHAHTASAVAEAKALGLEPDDVAKTLVVKTAEGYLRAVVPASCRLDERKVRDMTGGGLDAAALLCAVGSSRAPPRRPSGGRCAKRRERRAGAFRREFGASTRPALRRGAAGCAHRARPAATCPRRRAVGA